MPAPWPHPTNADLALNPNGSLDADGISNAIEVWQGTNPCDGYTYNPCPYYSLAQVNGMPTLDWDRDGVGNADEVYRGTNPCQFNSLQPLPHVTAAPRTGYFAPRSRRHYAHMGTRTITTAMAFVTPTLLVATTSTKPGSSQPQSARTLAVVDLDDSASNGV